MRKHIPAAILSLSALSATVVGAQPVEPLTLRVNDSGGDPDGMVAVVIRTYSPKGVGAGQTCMYPQGPNCPFGDSAIPCFRAGGEAGPFASLEGYEVFSSLDDAQTTVTFDPVTQLTDVTFVSASGTINETDGPLAVFYYRLRADATFGDEWIIGLEPSETLLLDPQGQPIPFEIRPGDLAIRSPGDPYQLEADGDEIWPGGIAALSVETTEIFDIASGEVGFVYDPAVADGDPVVTIDTRYGSAQIQTSLPEPGMLLISFTTPPGEPINFLPGQLFSIDLPTSSDIAVGTVSPISLDVGSTFLVGSDGKTWPLVLEGAEIEFVVGEVFDDGFETGSTELWTTVIP